MDLRHSNPSTWQSQDACARWLALSLCFSVQREPWIQLVDVGDAVVPQDALGQDGNPGASGARTTQTAAAVVTSFTGMHGVCGAVWL